MARSISLTSLVWNWIVVSLDRLLTSITLREHRDASLAESLFHGRRDLHHVDFGTRLNARAVAALA